MYKTLSYLPRFDSASSMLFALGCCLHDHDFPGLAPGIPRFLFSMLNVLPERARKAVYALTGGMEAIPERKLAQVSAEEISQWVIDQYPDKSYPAVMIGPPNGAAIHLCAALGIPWLTQTFLLVLRRGGVHPDDPKGDIQWAKKRAEKVLSANPELQIYQQHDPVQDRLMVSLMCYFRLKRIRMGKVYENFLKQHLPPGGTIFILDCRLKWPVTQIGERYYFQFGGHGDCSPEEYLKGGPRVNQFLKQQGSQGSRWYPPPPDFEAPEAEWGFLDSITDDIHRLARDHQYRICRITFNLPQDFSPFTAGLYEYWYSKRGVVSPRRLLLECFALVEPWWCLRSVCIPYWLMFNTQPALEYVKKYLGQTEPFDEIFLSILSNGIKNIGLIDLAQWRREVLSQAQKRSVLLGVDPKKFPTDLASFVRYKEDLKKEAPLHDKQLRPLSLEELEEFVRIKGAQFFLQA